MGSPENDVQNACLAYLRLKHIFCWRQNNQGRYLPGKGRWIPTAGMKGVSDILGIYAGRLLAVECKSAKGWPTPDQAEFLERVRLEGGLGQVVRSAGELKNWLKFVDKSASRK